MLKSTALLLLYPKILNMSIESQSAGSKSPFI